MEIRDIRENMDIIDIMDIIDLMEIMNITARKTMDGAVLALVISCSANGRGLLY